MIKARWYLFKKWLANWLVDMAFKLDRFHVKDCIVTTDSPSISLMSYVPKDGKWHRVSMNLSYWFFHGGEVKKDERVYIDNVCISSERSPSLVNQPPCKCKHHKGETIPPPAAEVQEGMEEWKGGDGKWPPDEEKNHDIS